MMSSRPVTLGIYKFSIKPLTIPTTDIAGASSQRTWPCDSPTSEICEAIRLNIAFSCGLSNEHAIWSLTHCHVHAQWILYPRRSYFSSFFANSLSQTWDLCITPIRNDSLKLCVAHGSFLWQSGEFIAKTKFCGCSTPLRKGTFCPEECIATPPLR